MVKIAANRKLLITLACLFLLYTTWGMVYLSIKFALESFPPIMLSGIRYFSAGSILLAWSCAVRKEYGFPSFHDIKVMLLGSFGMIVISGALLNVSEVYVSSGVTALILGSTPLWMVVAGWLFGGDPRPGLTVSFGLTTGFVGVVVLAVAAGFSESGSFFGILCAFGSFFGWVAGSLFSRGHHVKTGMIKSLGFQMVSGGLAMLVIAYFIGEYQSFAVAEVTLKSFLSLIHLVVFGSLVGYTCYVWLLYNTPTPVAVSYAYVEPVIAVALGAVFAGEPVTAATVSACFIIIASVFFVMRGKLNSNG